MRLLLSSSVVAAVALVAVAARAADEEATDTVSGEIVVDLRDDATSADEADIATRYGVALRPNSSWSEAHDKLEIADMDPAREDALIRAIAADARVEHVEEMALYRASGFPNDPLFESKQWHLRRVGAERAWGYTCGRGVTVAVVDTGIACFDRGPFSRGSDLVGTRCEGGWNFVDDSPNAADDQGHGTHVAGTIAQTTNNAVGAAGLAFCATLMPVKVLNRQGFGTVANVAEGIRRATDEGAQIINLSLGGPLRSSILADAVRHAIDGGVVVVAAAGNSGGRVGWPAAYPGVVAVSATDENDKIAWFSSRGPEVTVAAPGVGVTQQTVCNGGRDRCEVFGTFNGTSMASPHVAGAAAMVEALGVTKASAVRDALTSTARPQGDAKAYGAGIVDVGAAVASIYWTRLLLRALALGALAWMVVRRIRKKGGRVAVGFLPAVGAAIASVGLFPALPLLGAGAVGRPGGWLVDVVTRPVGEWDIVLLGVGSHAWFVVGGALPVFALAAAAFGVRRVRPFIGAFALGTAALLAQVAWSGDVAFPGGSLACRVWCAASALLCLWVARVGLTRDGRGSRPGDGPEIV